MLSRNQILRQMHFNAQYGPPEDSFSPDWHARNQGPGPDAAPVLQNLQTTGEGIGIRIRHVILASGDTTITNDPDYILPDGARFRD